jgi:hypothetical protein
MYNGIYIPWISSLSLYSEVDGGGMKNPEIKKNG